ncbi:hypothetical protein Bca4012_037299 [Brassica carinata]|uniref:Uncharacterized protein n=1 Tax=Brassica carinata TaxID=52824 RepID=A0A8X7WDT0_BRACI|nr:hypothetical protein Bca52824_010989 [Brassica carinata]
MDVDMRLLDSKATLISATVSRLTGIFKAEKNEPVQPIPEERFWFHNHSELLELANTKIHLLDLIGELTGVKSTKSDPTQGQDGFMTGELQVLPVMMMLQRA